MDEEPLLLVGFLRRHDRAQALRNSPWETGGFFLATTIIRICYGRRSSDLLFLQDNGSALGDFAASNREQGKLFSISSWHYAP